MSSPYSTQLEQIHRLIQAGQGGEAQALLKDLAARKTPRDFRAKLAQLSWRAGLPEAGLLALHAIVRPSERKKKEASVEEKLEYAACLMRLGATPEALGILDSIAEPTPKTSLYRAFAYFGSWAYQEAIPLLQEFLEAPGEDPYQRLVAKVNLASALVFERQEVPATALLRELLHDTSLHKHTRLLANALEISATHAVFLGDLAGAGTFLDRARTLLKESNTVDRLFIDKWSAIVCAKLSPSSENFRNIHSVRSRAVEFGHWETVRDCDRFLALIAKDEELLLKLYFGTPHKRYREYLLKDFGEDLAIPKEFNWAVGNLKEEKAFRLFEEKSNFRDPLKVGQLPHRLLGALCSDFYRPRQIAALFSEVFGDEFFNPSTSPGRIHQGIVRLREWFELNKIPLGIAHQGRHYRLVAKPECTITVPHRETLASRGGVKLEKLREKLSATPFSLKEAAFCLAMSDRSATRLLADFVADGILEKTGGGRSTRYRFKA